jgi:hypothetical protein
MAHEDPPSQGSPVCSNRSHLAKVGVAYLALIGLGLGVVLAFVPSLFDFTELSFPRLLVLLTVLIFVGAPVVAIGYVLLSAAVEALTLAVGWVFQACYRTLARFFK